MSAPAVILLSGGLDSATVAAIAREQGFDLHALSFDYGQRHKGELDAARRVAKSLGIEHHVVLSIDLRAFGGSALTSNIDVPKTADGSLAPGIPITYVPARNTVFLSFALGFAEVLSAADIFLGVNAVDYSGYPDCRPEYIETFERMANLATKASVEGRLRFKIHTPLISWTKADIIRAGVRLGVDYGLTRSCYDPSPSGQACGACDACHLRLRGFAEAGLADPGALPHMRIAEIYRSVQGEGFLTGTESSFVRASGCNLRCSYCDTPYASWEPEGEDLAVEAILARLDELDCRHVVITGGEPMLFAEMIPLADGLRAGGRHITIETAGTLYLPLACDLMSISPKLANSTPDARAGRGWTSRHERSRHVPEVVRRLMNEYPYQVKFVVGNIADCQEVERYLDDFPEIDRQRVMLMPLGIEREELERAASWLEPYCRQVGLQFCPRKHIEWFGLVRAT